MKITRIDKKEKGKTSYSTIYSDKSSLIEDKSSNNFLYEGYSTIPGQFRFWVDLEVIFQKCKIKISLHFIGYGLKSWDSNYRLEEGELNNLLLKELPKYLTKKGYKIEKILEYEYSPDISLHSSNGSLYCT